MQFENYVRGLFADLPLYLRTGFIAGGALRAHFDGTPVKDIDVFFRTEAMFKDAVADALADLTMDFVETRGRTYVFHHMSGREVNLIGFGFCSMEETIDRFDFRCCRMAACLLDDDHVLYAMDDDAAVDATKRRLVVLQNNGDARTERRIRHYIDDYGYSIDLSVTDHLDSEESEFPDDQAADQADAHFDGHAPYVPPEPPRVPLDEPIRRYIRRVPKRRGCGYP